MQINWLNKRQFCVLFFARFDLNQRVAWLINIRRWTFAPIVERLGQIMLPVIVFRIILIAPCAARVCSVRAHVRATQNHVHSLYIAMRILSSRPIPSTVRSISSTVRSQKSFEVILGTPLLLTCVRSLICCCVCRVLPYERNKLLPRKELLK